ncbi:MAG TPA: hypothetical protein VK445_10870 [Dissulfurispiraceae bacterium]|nr:hypothetical protein [Dissulfurispiraceae bacterium]
MFRALCILTAFLAAIIGVYYWIKSPAGTALKQSAPSVVADNPAQTATVSPTLSAPVETLTRNENPSALFAEFTEPKQAPAEHREMHSRAKALFEKGQFAEALGILKQLEQRDKSVLATIGYIHYHMRNMDDALIAFEESLRHQPASEFNVRKKLVEIYLYKENRSKAQEHLERALALRPQDTDLQAIAAWIKREDTAHAKYVEEKSDRFKVTFDGHAVGAASRIVLRILDDAYRQIGRELNYFPEKSFTVIIYTQRDFRNVTRLPEWAGGAYGIFDGVIRIPVHGAEGQEAELRRVLFHEYTHALIHTLAADPPLWLNEGLAEYFAGGWPQRTVQHVPLTYLHDRGSFARLGDVSAVNMAYWESYSAAAYLADRYGKDRILALLRALGKTGDADQAFRDSIGISYRDFVETWEPAWKKKK